MLTINAALAFAVEMTALCAWGLIGWRLFDTIAAQAVAAVAGVVLFALLWGVFAAPKSARRLPPAWLALFKAVMFASGALVFAAAGYPGAGLALASAGAVQIGLALCLDAL